VPSSNRPRFIALTQAIRQSHPHVTDPVVLIQSALVIVNGVIVTNPAARVPANAAIRLRRTPQPRGQLKLSAALDTFAIPVRSRTAVDIGASAGGFTLALLHAGASRVYAIDAGHGQLLGSLRNDPRVVNLENTNVGSLTRHLVPEPIEVITVDLSYLAVGTAGPQFEVLDIAAGADLVVLIKPMYELGLAAPPLEADMRHKAVESATAALDRCGWQFQQGMESPIPGRRGAIEHLVHLRRR
jgi:23S rRNA (cytidine1920-2'-O)/16S rRNA (cytidine1409-2'-O)-methyltransferase